MKCYCIATKNDKNIVGFYMSGENMEDIELKAGFLWELVYIMLIMIILNTSM